MIPITRVICIYASKAQTWGVELTLGGAHPTRARLPLRGPEHVETFLDAFDACDTAVYDAASGEVRFAFEGDEDAGPAETDDDNPGDDPEADATADPCGIEARPGENDGGFAGEIVTKESP